MCVGACACDRTPLLKRLELGLASELEYDTRYTVDCGRKWLADLTAGKTQLVLLNRSNNSDAINVKMDESNIEKNHLSLLIWIVYFAKTALTKISAFIRSTKFLFPEAALYLYDSTIRSSLENCCYVCAGVPSSYLNVI